jgi:hypothetical protein
LTNYDERFSTHSVFESLKNLEDRLREVEENLEDAESVSEHARLGEGVRYLTARLGRANPSLVSVQSLDAIQTSLESALQAVVQFTTDGAPSNLSNAGTHIEAAIRSCTSVPTLDETSLNNVQETIVSFRRSASQHLRHLEVETSKVKDQVGEVQAEIEKARTRIDGTLTSIENASSEATAAFAAEKARLTTEVTEAVKEERARVSDVISEVEARFKEALESQEAKIQSVVASANEETTKAKERANAVLSQLQGSLDEARDLVGVLARTTLSGAYLQLAESAHKRAFRWLVAAMVFTVLGVLAAGAVLLIQPSDGFDLASSIRRGLFVIAVFAPAAICSREARDYRLESLSARDIGAQLQSIEPFLEGVGDLAPEVLKTAADRYFVGGNLIVPYSKSGRRLLDRLARDRTKNE